jgi:AcrR family transcriptional regulator
MTTPRSNGQLSKKDIRRDQIMHAALKIIARRGVSGLTTAAIANEARMSEANLYRHFASKEDILAATIESVAGEIEKNFSGAFRKGTNPAAGLRAFFRLQLALMGGNSGIPRFLFSEELHGAPRLREKLLSHLYRFAGRLEEMVRAGQSSGAIRSDLDARVVVMTFISMVQGLMFRWSLSGFSFSLSREGVKFWKNFEKCLAARKV